MRRLVFVRLGLMAVGVSVVCAGCAVSQREPGATLEASAVAIAPEKDRATRIEEKREKLAAMVAARKKQLEAEEEAGGAAAPKPLSPSVLKALRSSSVAGAEAGPTVDMPFVKGVPLAVVLSEFRAQTGIRIETRGRMPERVVAAGSMTAEQLLERVVDTSDRPLLWRKHEGKYELWDRNLFCSEVLPSWGERRVLSLKHASAPYVAGKLKQARILTPELGNIIADERTDRLLLFDLPEVLEEAAAFVELLDVPAKSEGSAATKVQ